MNVFAGNVDDKIARRLHREKTTQALSSLGPASRDAEVSPVIWLLAQVHFRKQLLQAQLHSIPAAWQVNGCN